MQKLGHVPSSPENRRFVIDEKPKLSIFVIVAAAPVRRFCDFEALLDIHEEDF
jgi:hypothetical protein